MSSSTFEVRESESDSEKVLDFGLDTCEENGVMTTQIDGELPKDHTYTKEPDVLQEEELKDSGNSSDHPEEMDETATPVKKLRATKAKSTRSAKKNSAKAKAKSPVKKETPKRGRTKREEVVEEPNSTEDDAGNGETDDADAKEQSKAAVRKGRKRKVEEKENVPDEEVQNATEEAEENDLEEPPKKKSTMPLKTPKGKKDKIAVAAGEGDEVSTDNLPKGWVRKTVTRKSGKSAGQVDVYIYSPDGFKFRSKPDIASYLLRTKSNLKIDAFDFSKKKAALDAPASAAPVKAPKKKAVKPKKPEKKKAVTSPKKSSRSPKLLVKIVSSKTSKSRAAKSAEEKSRSPAKGRAATKVASKGSKKKRS